MVEYRTIFYESEVTVIVDDVNGSDWIFLIFLTNFDVLISKDVVAIEIEPWASLKQALVTSKGFKVTRL